MQIKILDEAEKDIAIGISFYEAQKDGLGRYFLDSILSDIESLHIYAGIHIIISDYYRLLSKRFPFSIYYLTFAPKSKHFLSHILQYSDNRS